jgi:hypothetical protein
MEIEISLPNKDFSIEFIGDIENGFNSMICYKGYPLIRTQSLGLEEYEFFILDETSSQGKVFLACKDEVSDIYIMKRWTSIRQALDWIREPKNN